MCGITGIVATRDIGRELFDGMQRLEYRGYDAALGRDIDKPRALAKSVTVG
jgi:glucosamine 6-phosphate synthetase-like amidotransferase/phosphosugar isomerase protein